MSGSALCIFVPILIYILQQVIEEEKEKRMDLCIMARSYHGQLRAKRPTMMQDKDFHLTKGKPGAPTAAENGASASEGPAPKSARSSAERTPTKERRSKSRSQSREPSVAKGEEKSPSSSSRSKSSKDRDSRERSQSKVGTFHNCVFS